MRYALPLLLLWTLGCDAATPELLEVEPPSDSHDPIGPYQLTAITRGRVDKVQVVYAIDAQSSAVIPLKSLKNGRWRGALPGVAWGSEVTLFVQAIGPGGTVQWPAQGSILFQIIKPDGPCLVDGDCLTDEHCDQRTRRCKPTPEQCQNDGDCPQDYVCPGSDRACRFQPTNCEADRDCGAGLVCEAGYCVSRPECRDDAECPDGRCLMPPGRCLGANGCAESDDCPAEAPICADGRCVPDVCECAAGQHCMPGGDNCVDCTADGHCDEGFHCNMDLLTCFADERGRICVPCGAGGVCGADLRCEDNLGLCLMPCRENRTCPSGFSCTRDALCMPDTLCAGTQCVVDGDCDSGVCQSGQCEPRQFCMANSDCRDRDCRNGRCVPREASCRQIGDCESGTACVGGRCTPADATGACGACEQSSDCADSAFCGDGGESRICFSLCGLAGCPAGLACQQVGTGIALCLDPATGGCPQNTCQDDSNEPNNTRNTGTELGFEVGIGGRVCPGDPDYFILVEGPVRLSVQGADQLRLTLIDEAGQGRDRVFIVDSESIEVETERWERRILIESVLDIEVSYRLVTRRVIAQMCQDDGLEDNDQPGEGFIIRNGAQINGILCPDDPDWFQVRMRPDQGGVLQVTPNGRQRIHWELRNSQNLLIRGAVGVGGLEVPLDYLDEDGWRFGIFCEECARPINYQLITDFSNVCADDGFEPNDDRGTAFPIETPFREDALVVCNGRDDWFVIEKAAGRGLEIQVRFAHANGDIDLGVRSAQGGFRDSSEGVGNREIVTLGPELAAGQYLIRVYVLGSDSNTYQILVMDL